MTSVEGASPAESTGADRRQVVCLAVILVFAIVPSLIVFLDRWLGSGLVSDLLSPVRFRWSLAGLGAWPATIVLVLTGLAAVFLSSRWPRRADAVQPPPAYETVLPPSPGAVQQRVAAVMLTSTGIAMIASLVWRAANSLRPGWDYAIPYVAFLAAWAIYETSIPFVLSRLAVAVRVWIVPIAAHLLLVLALWAAVDRRSWAVGPAILALAVHTYLWRTRPRALTPAFWLVSLNLVVTSLYFLGWWFSAIGDEYAFFDFANRLLEQASFAAIGDQIYNPAAVYAAHPGFSSLIQVAGMAIFGPGLFGWRFSGLYLAALSLWPFYTFVESIGGRRLAVPAGFLLAASHYLMSFGKIGYNNLQALFAFAVGLAAAACFVRSRSQSSAIALGAALGLCFFVYPGALLTIPVTLLYAASGPFRRAAWRRWALVGLALAATTAPVLVQRGFWETKAAGTLWQDPSVAGSVAAAGVVLRHLGQAGLSFLVTPAETHFVAVGFVDVVTAVFVILGLGAVLGGADRRSRNRFLLSLAILLVLVGALHGYSSPPTTRMFLLLPWLAILGAQGVLWLEGQLLRLAVPQRSALRVTYSLLGLILTVNLVQAYPLSRVRMAGRYQSPQVLLLREAEHLLDPGPTQAYLLLVVRPDSPLRASVARQLALHHVMIADDSLVEKTTEDVARSDLEDPRSIVLIAPRVPEARLVQLEARLQAAGKTACRFRSSIGEVRLVVWVAPAERYRCVEAPYRW